MADQSRTAVLSVCAGMLLHAAWAAAAPQQLPELPELPSGLELERAMAPQPSARALEGLSVQLWAQRQLGRDEGAAADSGRLVFDYARTWQLAPGWTARLSDQLDQVARRNQFGPSTSHVLNSLREAWVGWHSAGGAIQYYLDAGRINVRNGIGSGYNPTDFFKRDAVNRALATLDPGALRESRMGTVMLRAQVIGDAGAVTLGLAPRMTAERAPGDPGSDTSLALDRTNSRRAAYVKWSPQWSQRVSLDVLAFQREQERAQLGLNLSLLAGDAVVLNAEWTGARRAVLPGPGENAAPPAWRNRAAVNLVWTTPLGLELTLEREYAGDALDRAQWRRWRAVSDPLGLQALGALAEHRQLEQEPMMRDSWFARLYWRDAFGVRDLALACFTLRNSYDGSALTQVSASRSFGQRWRAGVLAAAYGGDRTSQFGSVPVRRKVAAFLDYRF